MYTYFCLKCVTLKYDFMGSVVLKKSKINSYKVSEFMTFKRFYTSG